MKLEFHPEAELELIGAALYYDGEVPGLGERLEKEVRRATDLLLQHPEIGAPVDLERRQFVLARFPFNLIYTAADEVVWILAVAHQKRRPGYWRSRG